MWRATLFAGIGLRDIYRVRLTLLRMLVACAAFLCGVCVESIHRYVQQQLHSGEPASTANSNQESSLTYPDYPEVLGVSPQEIAFFIEQHPHANLSGLWQRLGVSDDDPIVQVSFSQPGLYKSHIFEYDLDVRAGREVVLKIKQQFGESYRYLVFTESFDDPDHDWKFLGKIDVSAKYTLLDPVVLLSNGQAWLIIQSTGATGSGLAASIDTVYEVSDRGLRRVGSYVERVTQSGYFGFPSKVLVGRPLSLEIKNKWAILNVSYTVEYTAQNVPLFTKQKTAVLVQSLRNGSSFVDTARSEISPHELETIYNFDSMGTEDFLQYNRAELRAIATGNNSEKKKWLKDFLNTWAKSAVKDELLPLLH